MARKLVVWFNQEIMGGLEEDNNLWRFTYSPQWLASSQRFQLCPALPCQSEPHIDGSSQRPVQWFFDNLLPEEQARTLLAKDAKVAEADAFGLLAHFGAESAGALTLLGEDEKPGEGQALPLGFDALSERIKKLPTIPLSVAGSKRMSLAGAQHKLPVIYQDGSLMEPQGAMPSTHILKPEHSQPLDYPHSVRNEWFTMRLAHSIGLEVPETTVLYVPEPIYLVKRFDRTVEGNSLQRRHVVDACQLLSLDRAFKYSECHPDTMNRLISISRSKAQTRITLFRWILFNYLIGNADNHLKNLSFFLDDGHVALTPHYDLLSTSVYESEGAWKDSALVWPIGAAKRHGEVTLTDLIAFAGEIGVPAGVAHRTIATLLKNIEAEADKIIQQAEGAGIPSAQVAGELRQLRLIRYGVLKDMVDQIQG